MGNNDNNIEALADNFTHDSNIDKLIEYGYLIQSADDQVTAQERRWNSVAVKERREKRKQNSSK